MSKVESIVREALVAEGIALPNWRINIEVSNAGYQFVELEITVYEPRHRKPSCVWSAPYDSFRNLLHWEDAKVIYNRYFDK